MFDLVGPCIALALWHVVQLTLDKRRAKIFFGDLRQHKYTLPTRIFHPGPSALPDRLTGLHLLAARFLTEYLHHVGLRRERSSPNEQ